MQSENFDSDIFWIAYGEYNGRRAVKPFVRYFVAKLNQYHKKDLWEKYVANSINMFAQGKALKSLYSDLVKSTENHEEEKTTDEIIDDIMKRNGLTYMKSGE